MNAICLTICIVVILGYTTIDCNADGVKNTIQRTKRIVDGEAAQIKNYPYQVYIVLKKGNMCGGALISPKVVLTAAHCNHRGDQAVLIRAGSTDRTDGGQVRRLKYGITHPHYIYDDLDNDIALLILDHPFKLSYNVKTIKLPRENEYPYVGAIGVATGWGFVDSSSQFAPSTLRKVNLSVMNQKLCQTLQNKYGVKLPITRNKLCAGSTNNAHSICQGDSGGPFVINGVLHGITSHNSARSNCGTKSVPSVFTRVSVFRSWIRQTVNI